MKERVVRKPIGRGRRLRRIHRTCFIMRDPGGRTQIPWVNVNGDTLHINSKIPEGGK